MTEQLQLMVRLQSNSFPVEISETETVEALGIVIFSMHPELGEELRVVHKGRVLKSEEVLSEAGLKSGDSVAVARKVFQPSARTSAPEPMAVEEETAQHEEIASKAAEEGQVDVEMDCAPEAPQICVDGEASAPAQPSTPSKFEGLGELPVSVAVQTLIQNLESGSDAHPAELIQALHSIATRVEGLEASLGESTQALMLMNHLSARALQGLSGMPGVSQKSEEEAPGRSFLMKKGDADIHEAHQKALQQRPRTPSSGTATSGTLSTGATPMTKEEMDKA
eukprot:CAMPEP_0197627324 /NCGR_PEP_ID=MMETSP1338-20131121/5969_1 /TAXON_ID=43686 ORGANISM="Pelagodinium beii, Strain RCC1491" /NCGR_SAMPLE_ID=MMETSP1338 /ASSEMBLY_ACC=CAM_ASM_000754 /LENGTH=279 /DNA_ID=CAMNT_0043198015 /DNA_START=27 /DNA_END=862 /DNA_ORIENTATION=+